MRRIKPDITAITADAFEYEPVRIVEIELKRSLPSVSSLALVEQSGSQYQRALCLFRLHTQPLGVVELQLERVQEEYGCHIWRIVGEKINEHLREDGLPPVAKLDEAALPCSGTPRCIEGRERYVANGPFVSVIVSTRDRPEKLQSCLHTLLSLHYPRYEVIIVDNASSTTATSDYIRRSYHSVPLVRYGCEDRLGYSWARNCGIMAARGEFLAFTDDKEFEAYTTNAAVSINREH
jgi:Glycosyl transferase family 2